MSVGEIRVAASSVGAVVVVPCWVSDGIFVGSGVSLFGTLRIHAGTNRTSKIQVRIMGLRIIPSNSIY